MNRFLSTLFIASFLVGPYCYAQKSKKATAQKKSVAPRKTVGELLKQASRGSDLATTQKAATPFPSFDDKIFSSKPRSSVVDLKKVQPPRTSTLMSTEDDDKAKLEKITDQQIAELFKLLQRFKNSNRRGELWLRLAELYVEKASLIDFRRMNEYDARMKAFNEGKLKTKPVVDLREAKAYHQKAIQLYEWFVRDFPRDEKIDQALYFLGYNHFEINEIKKGLHYYSLLTQRFPNSSFIVESHFALGEYYFENENWKRAFEHYAQVVKNRKHRLYGFSAYKIAWCYFRMGDSARALNFMERIIKESRLMSQAEEKGKKNISYVRLEKEGLRDIVLFYADAGQPKNAIPYFTQLVGNDAPSYLERLAHYYIDLGHRESGREIFNHLIKLNPTHPKAFAYKHQIIQAYSTATKTREFREELYSWIKDFGINSEWYKANQSNTKLVTDANTHREVTLKIWVLTQHQTAQNTKAKFSSGLAYEGYNIFINEFPNSKEIADMRFLFGELLYDSMGKYEEAGAQYRWVVENAPNSKYGAKAADNYVLAYEKNLPKDKEITDAIGKSLEPVALGQKPEQFVQAAAWYIGKVPQGRRVAELKFRMGRLYYLHNQFDKATGYFREILKDHSKTKFAEYSANLLLDIYNLKQDYSGLEAAGKEILAIPSLAASTTGAEVRGVIEKAQFKKAQDLEVAKDYKASAEQFEYFAAQNPKTNLTVTAQFNAAINYERANMNLKAIAGHVQVLNSKDKAAIPLKPKSRRIIAKLYHDAGMLEDAAKLYAQNAQEAGKDPIRSNFYFNAAVIYEALGNHAEAIENYQKYFNSTKKGDRVDAVFQMGVIHKRAKQMSSAVNRFKEYLNMSNDPEKSVEAAYTIYEYYKGQGSSSEAEKWKRRVLNIHKQNVGAKYAAQVRLHDAQFAFAEFRKIKIAGSAQNQKKALDNKIAQLGSLTKKLAEIIKLNTADEIVSSLVLLGRANGHMGEAIIEAPIPKGLTAQEEKQYREEIEKVATPFAQKAKESFKTAIERGRELETYSKDYHSAMTYYNDFQDTESLEKGEIPFEIKQGVWVPE